MHQNNKIDNTCAVINLEDTNVIKVDVRVVFLELHDIETIYEKYTAEIYIEYFFLNFYVVSVLYSILRFF